MAGSRAIIMKTVIGCRIEPSYCYVGVLSILASVKRH